MTLETSSFNLKITNLFIGLLKNHPFLRPHSVQIKQLSYYLHSIEPSFKSKSKIINPEAIAYSKSSKHTLLTEWTSGASHFCN